jgi:hypothetical protein
VATHISVIDKRVHHRRCDWGIAAVAPDRMVVDGSSALADVLAKIKTAAGQDQLVMLSILAHGFGHKAADGKMYGGFGVEFCKENIDLQTVKQFQALRGMFASKTLGIELIGCGAAAQYRFKTAAGGWITGFGWRLCKALAAFTQTGVKASSELQDVDLKRYAYAIRVRGLPTEVSDTCADPGKWEGQVWIFTPDGQVRKAPGTASK